MGDARHRRFNDLMAGLDPDLIAAARHLREIVFEVDPHTVEVIRFGNRTVTYGVGPHETSEGYVYLRPYRRWVSLGFYRGAELPNPQGLLEGNDQPLRHLKVSNFNSAAELATRTLIVEAVAERRRALGI